jgi:hypothetical protein
VFYGKVDQKGDPGWYWTRVPGPGEPLKGPYNGPFKTKAETVEDANQAAVARFTGEKGAQSGACQDRRCDLYRGLVDEWLTAGGRRGKRPRWRHAPGAARFEIGLGVN